MPLTPFGHEMRRLRKEAGIRQKELAYRLGTTHSYVSGIERGDGRPSDAYIRRVAGAMGLNERQVVGLMEIADREAPSISVAHLTPEQRAIAGAIVRNLHRMAPAMIELIKVQVY